MNTDPQVEKTAMRGPDSRLVDIVYLVVFVAWQAAAFSALIWLAHDLRSAWPVAAIFLLRNYDQDFNQVRRGGRS